VTARLNKEDCILFSGAAQGAEAEFGAAAERHGIEEVNFTFEGHNDARTRGIRVLTHAELKHGDVSLGYVSRLMHREYRDTPLFKKVLQTIWHQVNSGQEIYVIGKILDDGSVRKVDLKVGDRVLFGKYSGTEVKIDGEERLILREDDILGVIEK